MKSYTQDNGLLWREIYLSEFDDPRKTFKKRQPNWEQEIKPLVKFQKILRSPKASVKSENMEFVCKTAVQLATEADHAGESKNLEKLRGFFENADDNSNMFIHGSRLYEMTARRKKANITEEMSQLIAQLHCLHGVKTVEYRLLPTPDFMSEIPLRAHPYARSIVYDIATYSDGNKWGPFSDSGDLSIDWEKVEAIMVDLAYNLNLYDDHTDSLKSDMRCEPFDGVQPDSYKSVIAEPDSDGTESVSDTSSWSASRESVLPPQLDLALEARDPYGVTGTWERVVCFLDYNDFVRFNFDRDLTVRRPPVHTQEALRLIRMLVHVTKIEEPGEMDGKELPVVHFEGRACSMHMLWDPNSNSRLTGPYYDCYVISKLTISTQVPLG